MPSGVEDFDEIDNIAAMSLGSIDAAVTNAYFTKEGRMNYINAVIKNNGSAIADSIIVSVHKGSQDGEVIYQTTVDDVLSCEELLVKAEIAENNLEDTSLFFVTAETQNDVNEYNNNSMAVKENKSEVKEKDIIFNTETKTAVIKSDKEYENVTIFFAAYKEGKLVTSQSVEKDLAAGENTAAPEKPEAFSLEDFDTVKVYIWENSSNMKPLFTPFVVKLTE